MTTLIQWGTVLALVGVSAQAGVDNGKLPPPAKASVDFKRDVQPLLAKHCHSCHGPQKQENDLRWDRKADALRGGASGPAIVPGKSAESRMIHLVAGLEPGLIMPKRGERLTAEHIGLLRAWIDQGAQWPGEIAAEEENDKAKAHWAFKPVVRQTVPETANKSWPQNPIDQFVLAKLEELKLAPSPEADRRTLIRRLSFDLIGLPPTPEEVRPFIDGTNPRAYEKLVDRLLASPRYGERWARHWLDTVHFGETHGYDKDKTRPNAWPYRDYVIRSLNEDKPYSRFVEEQIAGDVLYPNDPWATVALGYLAAGPWDFVGHVELPESKMDGLIARYNDRDDMVMNVMSTFQSLTVHCARCHNHKFDPISQKDYYSLQAVFAGIDRADRPVEIDLQAAAKRKTLVAEKKGLELRLQWLQDQSALLTSPELERLEKRETELALALAPGKRSETKSPGNGYHSNIEPTSDVEKWVQVDLGSTRDVEEVWLVPARPTDFADTPGFGFPARFRVESANDEAFQERRVLADHTTNNFVNPGDQPFVVKPSRNQARFIRVTATRLWQRTKDYVFALAELQVYAGGTNVALGAHVTAHDSIEVGRWGKRRLVDNYDSRGSLPPPEELVRRWRWGAERESLAAGIRAEREALIDPAAKAEVGRLKRNLDEVTHELSALPKPQMVYAIASDFAPQGSFVPPKEPRRVHLLKRGEVTRAGELMAPGALTGLTNLQHAYQCADPNAEAQRRTALAKWISDSRNLLTRRSIVNRVWHYHFGRGLVETPNDFGLMGAAPSHPELLDWLAYWFLDNGESLKKLHRLIVTSATYLQCSHSVTADVKKFTSENRTKVPASASTAEKIDSDNRYLWRMNRTRLDAECIRDGMLAVSGKLDLKMGGPSVQQFYFKDDHSPVYDYTRFDVDSPESHRRSIYRFIVRSVTDPFMDTLDCPDPSVITPKRNTTVTALQALAVLNNPFVVRQSEHFAERLRTLSSDLDGQIKAAFELALARSVTSEEAAKLITYAEKHGLANACRVLFNSNEFVFVD